MIIDQPVVSGSFSVTGSSTFIGDIVVTGSITASLFGTASQATSASFAMTASYAANVPVTASYALTASQAESASFAQTASYSLSGTGFPFSGSAVITGSLLVTNLTGSGVRYVVADANGLVTAQTASAAIKVTQAFTASLGQTTFSVANGYSTGYVDVFVNGTKLSAGEFTDTSGTNVVLATGSLADDIVEVVKYLPTSGVSNNVLRTLTTFTATASQSAFSVDYTPGLLDIFYNGSRLSPIEYTANNGTSFTLATASAEGDTLDVLVYSYQVGAYAGIGGSGQLNQVSFYTTTSSISGSNNFTYDGSTVRITGSLITSGSSTFVNIGPTVLSGSVAISGSLTVTQGVTISGSIASASYASNAELLDNLDSTAFVFTSSFNTYSSSMSTRTSNLESTASVLTSASASLNTASGSFSTRVTRIEGNYATTGSNVFTGAQTVCANITSTGTIIAQTLNVQQVTSSIVYSSGSNIFGCDISNVQQMTGSVRITGSLNVIGNACMTSVCSPAFVGGIISGSCAQISGLSGIQFIANDTNILAGCYNTSSNLSMLTITGSLAAIGANQQNFYWYVSASVVTEPSALIVRDSSVATAGSPAIILQRGFANINGDWKIQNAGGDLVFTDGWDVATPFAFRTGSAFIIQNTNGRVGINYPGSFTAQSNLNILTSGQGGGIQLNRNSTGSPTCLQSFGSIGWKGVDSANTNSNSDAMIEAIATENHSGITAATSLLFYTKPSGTGPGSPPTERFRIASNGVACFACDLTAKTIGTNDLILNNLNHECANYVDGTRGSWLIQEGACDLFIINQVSGKKYKFNLIEIK